MENLKLKYEIFNISENEVSLQPFVLPDGLLKSELEKIAEPISKQKAVDDKSPKTKLIVIIADHPDFYKKKITNTLVDTHRHLAHIQPDNENTKFNDVYNPNPILIIYSRDSFKGKESARRRFGLKYWDSSIWQYWVDTGKLEGRDESDRSCFTASLKKTLEQISWHFNFAWEVDGRDYSNIYSSDLAAKEFCEFSTRMYLNSFIANVEPGKSGGHAGVITPYPFFEESVFCENFNNSPIFQNIGSQLKWRVLLIDDKPERLYHLRKLVTSEAFGSKFEVLDKKDQPHQKPALYITQARNIAQAGEELKKRHYDLVLLDYLLDVKNEGREFGTSLFPDKNNVDDKAEFTFDKESLTGPNGKLWIFLTTCYSSAFMDGLREKAVSFQDNKWIINRGADPVNTPNAFLYSFCQFLELQLNTYLGTTNRLERIWVTALKELGQGFSRGWANSTLSSILNYTSKFELLRDISNVEENSLFAFSYLESNYYKEEMKMEQESGLYGYLTHLLFLLTSGDGSLWGEMKTDFDAIVRKIPANPKNGLKGAYQVIEDRIATLKTQYTS